MSTSAVGLLVGGQGRRLGGPKQTLIGPDGQSLLAHQTRRLEAHYTYRFLLVGGGGGETSTGASAPGWESLRDPGDFPGEGPMAGLFAALNACPVDGLILMPIDSPYFPLVALHSAFTKLAQAEMVGFLDAYGRKQWLPGAYRSSLKEPLAQALAQGQRSLGRWLAGRDTQFVPWRDEWGPAAHAFTNLNTPEAARQAGYRFPDR